MFDFFKKKKKDEKEKDSATQPAPEFKRMALDLVAEAHQLRDQGEYDTAHTKLTMALSYAPSAEIYLERARMLLAQWHSDRTGEECLNPVTSDLLKVEELDREGALKSECSQLRADIKGALKQFAASISSYGANQDGLRDLLDDLTKVQEAQKKQNSFLEPELKQAQQAVKQRIGELETEREEWNLNSIAEYLQERKATGTYEMASAATSEKNLNAFEKQVGFTLPDEFRKFTLSGLGGLYVAVIEEIWPRPQLGDVGPFWSFLFGIMVFGLSDDAPEWLDMRAKFDELKATETDGLVPFFQLEGDPDMFCFDEGGRIIQWRHDDPDEREVIDKTFIQLLMDELHDLEERKNRKLKEALT